MKLDSRRTIQLGIASGIPGIAATVILLWVSDLDSLVIATILYFVVITWCVLIFLFRRTAIGPWQIISNMIVSFRENDFTIRARSPDPSDAIGLALYELNSLSHHFQRSRVDKIESQKLLLKIIEQIDLAVFLFDHDKKLVLSNTYAADLYDKTPDSLIGMSIKDLGLTNLVLAAHNTSHSFSFPTKKSIWLVKHNAYREHGKPHYMVMLADITSTLREEELIAWKRLIRILAHEINNSMTPLKTTTAYMMRLLEKDTLPRDWQDDFKDSLKMIDNRVENLSRFVKSYSQIAKQPAPQKERFDLYTLIQRLHQAYANKRVYLDSNEPCEIVADESQIEQVLVNILKNATEANEETGGSTFVKWQTTQDHVQIIVEDEGLGIENLDDLFVPYFTTKEQGSGIGLLISRQIIESHTGSIQLDNRKENSGCQVTITLPLQ